MSSPPLSLSGHEKYTAPPVPSGNGCCPVKNTLKVYVQNVRARQMWNVLIGKFVVIWVY